jgi:uncharacterized protein (DUF433 family)
MGEGGFMQTKTNYENLIDRIEIDPRVCNGKPVIKGTRIPVTVILEQIAEGTSWDKIMAGYPELRRDSQVNKKSK